jgi:hypothetical protein
MKIHIVNNTHTYGKKVLRKDHARMGWYMKVKKKAI